MSTRFFGQISFAPIVMTLAMLHVQGAFSMEENPDGGDAEVKSLDNKFSCILQPETLGQILQKHLKKYAKHCDKDAVKIIVHENMFNNAIKETAGTDFHVDANVSKLISDEGMQFLYCRELAVPFSSANIDNFLHKTFDDALGTTVKCGFGGLIIGGAAGYLTNHPIAGALIGMFGGTSVFPFALKYHAVRNTSQFEEALAFELDEAAIDKWDCNVEEAIATLEVQEMLCNNQQFTENKLPPELADEYKQMPFVLEFFGLNPNNSFPINLRARKEKLKERLVKQNLRKMENQNKTDLEDIFRVQIELSEFRE